MITADDVSAVWTYWQTIMDHPKARMDIKREKVIRDRLKDGYSIDDLTQAIRGCACSEFHMGINDRKTEYTSVTLIFRDSDHVERFMAMGETADRLLAQMAERKDTIQQVSDLPAPPSPEQIARAREMMKTVKLRRVA